jgi:hypothetical protein
VKTVERREVRDRRTTMEGPTLFELERAELVARERRLEAEAEAERLIAAARRRVAELEAGTDEAVARGIADRRGALLDDADHQVEALEHEIAALEAEGTTPASARDERHHRAVALVVRMVLAEPATEGR